MIKITMEVDKVPYNFTGIVEYSNGNKEWYKEGKLHREDGHAKEYASGTKFWYKEGLLHRLDGPALQYSSGTKEWYIDGEKYTEKDFNKVINSCDGKVVQLKIKNVKMIDYKDWDKFVSEIYGKPYCFQQQEGCREKGIFTIQVPFENPDNFQNTTVREDDDLDLSEMGVNFRAWLNRDPKTPIKNQQGDWHLKIWWERYFYPNIEIIVNDLYEKNLLEYGEYIINID